jgi:hypothetical protein
MKRYGSAVGVVGLAVAACAMLLVAGSSANGATTSNVRLAHAVVGGPVVDVWVDGVLAEPAVSYESVTPYVPLAAGPHSVEVKLAGLPITVISQTVVLTSGMDLTIVGSGAGMNITTTALLDNNSVTNRNTIRLVHASPDTGSVDVLVTGTLTSTLVSELAYQEASGYIGGLGTGVVTFTVRPTGEITPVMAFTRTLESGTIHTLFIMGASTPPLSIQYPLKPVYVLDRQFSFVYLPIVSREYGP